MTSRPNRLSTADLVRAFCARFIFTYFEMKPKSAGCAAIAGASAVSCRNRRSRVIEQGNDPWDRVRAQFNLAHNEIDLSSAIHNILSVNVRRSSIIIERAAESSLLPLAGRYAKLASTETR